MHVPPSFQLTVTRFGGWRFSSFGLLACAMAVWSRWMLQAPEGRAPLVVASGAVLLFCCVAVVGMIRRLRPVQLRWDTQVWHLGKEDGPETPRRGRLDVAIDLGGWMLLRFCGEGREWQRPVWLAVQRSGHRQAWHSLRLAAYGARPALQSLPAQF